MSKAPCRRPGPGPPEPLPGRARQPARQGGSPRRRRGQALHHLPQPHEAMRDAAGRDDPSISSQLPRLPSIRSGAASTVPRRCSSSPALTTPLISYWPRVMWSGSGSAGTMGAAPRWFSRTSFSSGLMCGGGGDPHAAVVVGLVGDPPQRHVRARPDRDVDEVDARLPLLATFQGPRSPAVLEGPDARRRGPGRPWAAGSHRTQQGERQEGARREAGHAPGRRIAHHEPGPRLTQLRAEGHESRKRMLPGRPRSAARTSTSWVAAQLHPLDPTRGAAPASRPGRGGAGWRRRRYGEVTNAQVTRSTFLARG